VQPEGSSVPHAFSASCVGQLYVVPDRQHTSPLPVVVAVVDEVPVVVDEVPVVVAVVVVPPCETPPDDFTGS
jgi:hypothetical protein